MSKNKTLLIGIILLIATTIIACAGNSHKDFKIERNSDNKTVTIVQYIGEGSEVVIPDQIRGMPVTIIGAGSFIGKNITSVTIPDSVITIGDGAFSSIKTLTTVIIGNGVTSIGEGAFAGCTELSDVTIGENVTTISKDAFALCTALWSIIIPDSVVSIGNRAFSGSGLSWFQMGNSVESIGDYAFAGTELEEIRLPASVTSIGDFAFNCNNLKFVTIFASNPPALGRNAFGNARQLRSIFVLDSSVNAYRAANNWRTFARRIEEI
jgi:hypothetical protein